MTLQAAYKMERHTRLCSQFGLPVVNFVDQPGNATGLDAELAGTLLGAVRVGEALARWGSIPIEGGVMAAHKAEIEAAPDPAAKRAELEAHYLALTSPFRTAEKFGVLDIIDPRETRRVLCDWVEDAWYVVQGDLAQRAPETNATPSDGLCVYPRSRMARPCGQRGRSQRGATALARQRGKLHRYGNDSCSRRMRGR